MHHTPSPGVQVMFEAVVAGATDPEITGVEVVRVPAISAGPADVLEADGYLLGAPANIGYMSGWLKVFFDTVYYPCLDATKGRPYGFYLHGNQGTEGAARAVQSIAKGMGWNPAAAPVEVRGEPSKADLERCWELGATLAATLSG